jgi:hypothetical protein
LVDAIKAIKACAMLAWCACPPAAPRSAGAAAVDSGKIFNADDVNEVFELFYQYIATEKRPLYLHTADSNLRQMFSELNKAPAPIISPQPNIMPWKVCMYSPA